MRQVKTVAKTVAQEQLSEGIKANAKSFFKHISRAENTPEEYVSKMQGIKIMFMKMKARAEELHIFIISVLNVGKVNKLFLRNSLRKWSQIQCHRKGDGTTG